MQKIITEKIGSKVIVLLQGDVNVKDTRLSRKLNSPNAKQQEFQIWVDCSTVECLRTHGTCHFINQLLLLKAGNKVQITLINVSDRQRALLRLMRLESVFTIVPDLEVAYQQVQAPA